MSDIERGSRNPTITVVEKLAGPFEDASARAILGSADDPGLVQSIMQAALDVITLADAADAVRRHAQV